MKKPDNYELKKWLCDNTICGLKVHYYQTGSDTSDTDWELESTTGEKKRVRSHPIDKMVDVRPDWVSVLHVHDSVRREVKAWDEYAEKEVDELAEYERLKRKFEGV
jgi:hypothetical protein